MKLFIGVCFVASLIGLSKAFNHDAQPYTIIWQSITSVCNTSYNIDIEMERYGITVNKWTPASQYEMNGDVISILYTGQNDNWPTIVNLGKKQLVNGGVPQAGNISLFLTSFAKSVVDVIPDVNYSGLGVIDMELWAPLWALTFVEDYRILSKELIRNEHPYWPEALVEEKAITEFEKAARVYFEEALKLCKRMRPKATWGYYWYPRYGFRHINGSTDYFDDKMMWMYELSDVLLPSIYLFRDVHVFRYDLMIHLINEIVVETIRVRNKLNRPNMPIYFYVSYSPQDLPYYQGAIGDLIMTIGRVADSGITGVVVWRALDTCDSAERCRNVKTYIDDMMGPYIQTVKNASTKCSHTQCSGHGRCALLNPSVPTRVTMAKDTHMLQLYKCFCYSNWGGDRCQTPVKSSTLNEYKALL